MKSEFSGYYAPTGVEYDTLWRDGIIVLDTNVLLDLYRLPDAARDELIAVLELLKDRLWVPYQVALEFQRRRLSVIASQRKATEEALSSVKGLIEGVCDKVLSLQIDKRGVGLNSDSLIEDLRSANEKLISAIKSVHDAQIDIGSVDVVRDRLDELLEGKVGSAPTKQDDIVHLTRDGGARYDKKIPPGFLDEKKDKIE